jgi:hypothetical protein
MTVKPVGAVIALLLGLTGISAALPAAQAATTTSDAGVVSMTVAPDALGMLTDAENLHLTLSISNGSSSTIDAGVINTEVNRSRFTATDALEGWLATSEESIVTADTVSQTATTPIASGETRIVTVDVPSAALGFASEGVYALGVEFTHNSDLVAQARTAVSWKTAATNPLHIAVAAPLTLPSDTPGLIDSATLAEFTARGGILSEQLDAMIGSPVAIGIDPRVLASIRVLGTTAPPSALEWLDRLRTAPNSTFPLAYADSDMVVALQAGATAPLTPTSFDFALDTGIFATPDPTASPTPSPQDSPNDDPETPPLPTFEELTAWDYTYPTLAWPAANTITTDSLTAISAAGYSPTILSSEDVAETPTLTDSAGAAATVGDAPVAVADSSLSRLFQNAVESSTAAEWNDAMAQLSATVALESELAPGANPTVLATLDRTWADTGYRLEQTMTGMAALPWATAASLPFALGSPAEPTATTLVEATTDTTRVETVASLLNAEAAEAQFAVIAADPLALTAERRLDLLALLSNAWSDDTEGWTTATGEFLAESTEIRNAVQIAPSSTIQLPADRGSLPVTVVNNLSQAVTVYVQVRPRTPVLSVEDSFSELTVEPQSSRKAQIAVKSLSNGEVQLGVTLTDQPGGNQIGDATTVSLNVHAGWETAGTIAFGAVVVIIFGAGIVRTIRKRRRALRESE